MESYWEASLLCAFFCFCGLADGIRKEKQILHDGKRQINLFLPLPENRPRRACSGSWNVRLDSDRSNEFDGTEMPLHGEKGKGHEDLEFA